MKNFTCYLLLIIFFLYPPILFCNEAPFKSEVELGNWFSFYYINPEPAKINDAMKFFCNSSMFKKTYSRVYTATFFAVLLENDYKLTEEIFDNVSLNGSDIEKIFTLMILQLMNTDKSLGLIKKADEKWKIKNNNENNEETSEYILIDILDGPVNDPKHLDILWAVFCATGDDSPVKKIISAVQLANSSRVHEIFIGSAAEWSLISNAYQHKRVYEICKEELKISRGQTLRLLEEIVQEVEERQKYNSGETVPKLYIEELGKYNEKTRSWALALAGLLSEINNNKLSILPLEEITGESIRYRRNSLIDWWGDENRKDFLETLNWLYNEGHSKRFNNIKRIINTSEDKTIAEICEQYKFGREIKNKMLFVEKYSKYVGSKSLLAFDLGRYIWQCRCGFQAGYLNEDEAWMKIMMAAKRARNIFVSWEEFGTNYIIGRRFWQAGENKEEEVFKEAVKAYNNLLNKDGTWYKIPWNIDF